MISDNNSGARRDDALCAYTPEPEHSSASREVTSRDLGCCNSAGTSNESTRIGGPSPEAEKVEFLDWKAMFKQVCRIDEVTIIATNRLSASSREDTLEIKSISAPTSSAVVFDVVMTDDDEFEIVGASPACSADDFIFEGSEGEAAVEESYVDEIDDETFYEAYPEMRSAEMIDDVEELAHFLHSSGLYPRAHPRVEALLLRAAGGRGYYSQLLAASGII